jgi:indole-3-acetate monooxygenase
MPASMDLPDLTPLTANAALADAQGRLQPEQLDLIHAQGWLLMLAPRAVGGGERPLPEVVRLEEAVAAADGSCSWFLTLCAGAGWFAGFLPPALAKAVLATPRACLAGSGAATGVADREGTGWRVNGRWGHATGAPQATHFTFNARLQQDGLPLLDAQGQPRVRAFILPAAEVQWEPTWHSIGLRASASHAFTLQDVRAADEQAFDIDPARATAPGPLYRFPFRAFAFVTLAANLLGLARRFTELARPVITRRTVAHAADVSAARCQAAEHALDQARDTFYVALDAAWARAQVGAAVSDTNARELETLSQALAQCCRDAVATLYPCCGLEAADPRSHLNRVWRDFHTATQHAIWLD